MTSAPATAGPVALDTFFARMGAANPFTDNRINDPASEGVDVDDIHRAAFEQLAALATEACTGRRGLGAVLWGEAGTGKSHLLARLGRWAAANSLTCFVYLHNLQSAPDHLPRTLLRAVVAALTGARARQFAGTPLFRLVASFAHEACGYTPHRVPWLDVERSYGRLIEAEAARSPARAGVVDRTVYDVLYRFFLSAYASKHGEDDGVAALAVRWLSGDYLDPFEAMRLHLPPGPSRSEPVGLADNQQVKQVILALTRLALGARRPFLLCLDQVDNLDDAQMAALGRFLEALLDTAPNLLVVTAGIQASLLHWHSQKVIQESAWDRIAQYKVAVQRITPAEAERIVAARLARFLAPFDDLEEVQRRRAADPLFPLGAGWRAEFFAGRLEPRPRDVINWAREGFRREQEALARLGGPQWLSSWPHLAAGPVAPPTPEEMLAAKDRRVAQAVEQMKQQRLADPSLLPPDAGRLVGLVAGLLEQCRRTGSAPRIRGVDRPSGPKPAARLGYDLLLRRLGENGEEDYTRIMVVVTGSAKTAASLLRRAGQASGLPGRLFVVTDARQPLELGVKGQEYLDQLRLGGAGPFRQVELTLEEYAELDALQAVVGLARSGDLEVEIAGHSTPVGEAEVVASLHRQGMYARAPLLRELVGSAAGTGSQGAVAARR
jgi:hypothetical protein